jgi:hypothetical protein
LAELFDVALEYERAGRLADAERMLGHVLNAAPTQADALHLAGIVAYRLGRKSDALDLMQRSMRHGVNTPLYWRNIGEVYRVLGRLDEALAAGQRAVALNPDDPVTLANLAVIHSERQEFDQAEACERAALALDPGHAGAHFGLAEVLLARGDFARGWEEYEWRYQLEGAGVNLPPGGGRQWDGRPMPQGRLLVIADQGFGDTIQFGRYLPWVLQRCPDLVVASGPEMWPLLAQLGARNLRNRWQDLPAWNAYIPLTGLPRLADTRLETIPADIPYLHAPAALASRWASRLDQLLPPGMRRVGLVWAGRQSHVNDHRRSAPLASLAPLFAVPRVAYVSLQKDRHSELARLHGGAPVLNLGPELATWEDTAAVLSGLDAVVSVDTAVAHLAGALGRPVHLLLPHAAEWRWLLGRDTSPWYPTMRLHRQRWPGDWADPATAAARGVSLMAPL